ncbi:MAG: molybdenum cofactor guanylyltransferase MobA [Campylobacterota bacterium]
MQNYLFEDIVCVILCGGKSSRMKRDKSLLPFLKANSLAQYQFDRLKPYFKEVYLSSKNNKFDFINNKNLIIDTSDIYSPIIALKSIFAKLQEKKLFIITVDTPLVTIDSITKLIEKSNGHDITIAKTQKTHNLCGVFNTNIVGEIDYMIKNDIHKVGYLIKSVNSNIVDFENDDEFINLNFYEQYQEALKNHKLNK